MDKKIIVVTGGAGAIGGNLVKNLLGAGRRVAVIDNLSSGSRDNCPGHKNLLFCKGSILNDKLLERIFLRSGRKIEAVFHLAAHFANQNSVEHPQADFLTNILGTLKLLEFSKRVDADRFVYASSSCVYGNTALDLKEDLIFDLETPYAISKLCGEQYAHFYRSFHNLKIVILRYFNAYGPGDPPGEYRNVIPNFMFLALKGKPLVITGTGEETRDFTYMDDIVRGTILATRTDKAFGETFNIGSGREIKIKYVAELINKFSRNKAGIKFVQRRKWDAIKRRVANIEKSKKILRYSPAVSFEEGMERTFRWFKQRYFS